VRKGVWKELDGPQVKVDAYRRNLQRAYLDLANTKLNGPSPSAAVQRSGIVRRNVRSSGDEKPFYRAELRTLNTTLGAALGAATDRPTRAHIEAARDQIAKILDPKFATPGGASATGGRGFGFDSDQCWPDYVIEP
jgi:hypothetical protein